MNLAPRTSTLTSTSAFPSPLAVLGLLALLVGLAYANSLRNGFVYDDNGLIVHNGLITRLDTLPTLVSSDYWITAFDPFGTPPPPISSGLYRPLVSLSYALNYALGGLEPMGYHLLNVLLHLLVTWLLYLLACRLQFPPEAACVGAVLFALHPLHTEAVTNVVGRAELFMALGVLGSLWFAATGRRGWSLAAFAAGLFSKEQAVVLPVLLILLDLCLGRPRLTVRGALSRYGGYLLVLAGYLVIRGAVLGGLTLPPAPFIDNPLGGLAWLPRTLSALKVAWLYLQLFLWPAGLSLDYSYDAIPAAGSLLERDALLGLCAWGGLAGGMVWSFLKRNRQAAFALGFTLLTFLPVSNLVILIGTIMGERLFYLPSAGLCLLAGLWYERLLNACEATSRLRSRFRLSDHAALNLSLNLNLLLRALLVLICLALLARTAVRNLDWLSGETAFQSALLVVPRSAKLHAHMGILAASKEAWGPANRYFATALRLYPGYSLTDGEMAARIGAALLGGGDTGRALDILERAVALERESKTALYNLGLAYTKAGRYGEAEGAYRRHIILAPEAAEGYNGLSYALTRQQRYAEAEAMAVEAIHRRPEFAEAHYNRGRALEGLGRKGDAIAEYERVIELSPAEVGVQTRLARLRAGRRP